MSFRDQLSRVCTEVDGALAATVMGFDGIPIEHYEHAPAAVDIPTLVVEYSNILGEIRKAALQLKAGEAMEISIRAEKVVALARVISGEYFLALALTPDGNVGKARYALRVAAPRLKAELT